MNYRLTLNGETIARFKLMEDAKFFVESALKAGMITSAGASSVLVIARNGETFTPSELGLR